MPLRIEHDPEANALYVRLADGTYAYGEDLDRERRVDYDATGAPIGVEFTCVAGGVDLADVPRADEIAAALKGLGIKALTPEA